jgi:hypothetical protein
MDKFQLKSQFNENTTKARSQWSYMGTCPLKWMQIYYNRNILVKFSQTNLYYIQITRKIPMYNKKPLMSQFI